MTTLRDLRLAAGLTQDQVARLIGRSLRTVNGWERGNQIDPIIESVLRRKLARIASKRNQKGQP